MKSNRTITSHRYWILLALLAFTAQMVFSSAHAVTMLENMTRPAASAMSGCHSDTTQKASKAGSTLSAETTDKCCDDNCSMIGCHATGALLSSSNTPDQAHISTEDSRTGTLPPIRRSNSPYRPPIFG